ncbi:MAG TPA: MFS transporter, partial [Paenibacillus sp.]|nr:MFS transporter [Paenibacillus sp.]
IVNVASPSIQRGLGADFSSLQFVLAGYSLAYAVALIVGGRLGDRFGHKRVLWVGVAGFTSASFLCGIAVDVPMLVVVRVLQGLSAAMMVPQVLSLIQLHYPPEKRAGVFGLYGASQGIAAATGQLIGGGLLWWNPAELDWRLVFFFSVAIGAAILCMLPFVDDSKSDSGVKLDWTGAGWVTVGLLMLLYPLVQGQKEGWPAPLLVCLALSVPVLGAFAWYESRLGRSGGAPFMNVDLFRQRRFTIGMLVVFTLLCSQSANFFLTPYVLQMGLGFTALQTGLVILPMGIGYFFASMYSAKATAKFGRLYLVLGASLVPASYVLFAVTVHLTGTAFQGYEYIPALALLGFGQGAVAAPLTTVILSKIDRKDAGSASGIVATGMQTAFAVGIALIGIALLNLLASHSDAVGSRFSQQLRAGLMQMEVKATEAERLARKFERCYVHAGSAGEAGDARPYCERGTDDSVEAEALLRSIAKQASASNYARAFEICLYGLAGFTAFMLPLILALTRSDGRRMKESAP